MSIFEIILKDDATLTGGKAHSTETLLEFLESINMRYEVKNLEEINTLLIHNGLLPLYIENYPELLTRQYNTN